MRSRNLKVEDPVSGIVITNVLIKKENNDWFDSLNKASKKLNLIHRNITKSGKTSEGGEFNIVLQEVEIVINSILLLIQQVQFRSEVFAQLPNSQKIHPSDLLFEDHISTKNEFNELMKRVDVINSKFL